MEGKPTGKPSQESGPQTRKRIIIKKNPHGCDSNVGGIEGNKQTQGWVSEDTFIGFTLSEEGNTSFLIHVAGTLKIKTISKSILIYLYVIRILNKRRRNLNLSKICVTRMLNILTKTKVFKVCVARAGKMP